MLRASVGASVGASLALFSAIHGYNRRKRGVNRVNRRGSERESQQGLESTAAAWLDSCLNTSNLFLQGGDVEEGSLVCFSKSCSLLLRVHHEHNIVFEEWMAGAADAGKCTL
jgi:hypothetical protein